MTESQDVDVSMRRLGAATPMGAQAAESPLKATLRGRGG